MDGASGIFFNVVAYASVILLTIIAGFWLVLMIRTTLKLSRIELQLAATIGQTDVSHLTRPARKRLARCYRAQFSPRKHRPRAS